MASFHATEAVLWGTVERVRPWEPPGGAWSGVLQGRRQFQPAGGREALSQLVLAGEYACTEPWVVNSGQGTRARPPVTDGRGLGSALQRHTLKCQVVRAALEGRPARNHLHLTHPKDQESDAIVGYGSGGGAAVGRKRALGGAGRRERCRVGLCLDHKASEGPEICPEVGVLVIDGLGRHVLRCSHELLPLAVPANVALLARPRDSKQRKRAQAVGLLKDMAGKQREGALKRLTGRGGNKRMRDVRAK